MKPPSEKQAALEITELLTDLLGIGPRAIRLRPAAEPKGYDYLVSVLGHRFVLQYKRIASAGPLAEAVGRLKLSATTRQDSGQPLIVVPFMGEVGKGICDRTGVSWMDLSGNAKITAPDLRIHIEGRPNKYTDRGRPPNVFASKSSRVTRQLLLCPQKFQTQAEITRQTGLGDGYVSKIVRRLEQEKYVTLNDDGALRPRDPNLLLDAWHAAYDFNRHRILKGHVPARSGDELLQRVDRRLSREKIDHAATGLAAAWLYTNFVAFRQATIYLTVMPTRSLLKDIEFSDEPKGANLWLVQPDDEGVFHDSQDRDGVRCVSPLQTYLDLKDQPERSKDAAIELRKKLLTWRSHGT